MHQPKYDSDETSRAIAEPAATLTRALAVLRRLADAPDDLSLAEIALSVGLPKSTVHRLVTALRSEGFIESTDSGSRIRLGVRFHALAAAAGEMTNGSPREA